jgi:hypothetical protein
LEFGRLLLVALFTTGFVVGLAALRNARDRRRAALRETVWCLAPPHLCSVIAMARWRARLPPGIRLLVNGTLEPDLAARAPGHYDLSTKNRDATA